MPRTGSEISQQAFLHAANEALEDWAADVRPRWTGKVWVTKTPSTDGNFDREGWRAHCDGIVARFNDKVAPIQVVLEINEKEGLREKQLKVTRKVLVEKATAQRAAIRVQEALQ
jgi:hypothetical protein